MPGTATAEALSQPKEIKRLVFGEVPLGAVSGNRLKMAPGQEVGVMSLSPGSTLAAAVADRLQEELKIAPLALDLSGPVRSALSRGGGQSGAAPRRRGSLGRPGAGAGRTGQRRH